MSKFLVETKDSIQVVGFGDEMHAHYNRPSVVGQTDFMAAHIASGQVVILSPLEDDATDAELEKQWAGIGDGKDLNDPKVAAEVAAQRRKVIDDFTALYGVEKKSKSPKGT